MSTKKGKKSMFPVPKSVGFIEVKTKEGVYRRRNRGTVKPAVLNAALTASSELMKRSTPAAKRMQLALKDYTDDLETGRIMVRMGGKIRSGLKERGGIDYTLFKDFDWQKDYPLDSLLRETPQVKVGKNSVEVRIRLSGSGSVDRKTTFVDSYRFVLVLLSGDPLSANAELRTRDAVSERYLMDGPAENCVLTIPLEKGDVPWLLWLRLECMEEGEPSVNPKNRGMKALAASNE